MSESSERPRDQVRAESPASGFAQAWAGIAGWQRVAAILSVLVMAGGLALGVVAGGDAASAPSTQTAAGTAAGGEAGGASGIVSGLAPGDDPLGGGVGGDDDATEEADGDGAIAAADDPWSPAVFRMGFSFFVGFAIAFALRAFVKLSLISLGMFFLALFGLQYAGFIEVNWAAIGDRYESVRDWLAVELDSFRAFATGYLPSAGMALAGLATGFRRRG